MTVFKLPDLGEGLPDAEIVSWTVKEGDTVREGDNMVEMSTAKAVVEVPAPYSGRIVKLHGAPGDVIKTGAPLVTFQLEGDEPAKEQPAPEAETKAEEKPGQKPVPESQSGAVEVFKLPDLGEGLQEAEIVQWFVAVGDKITEGDNMVEMSTAKAVVEVPAPHSGKVVKLYGGPGDVIKTGAPLIEFDTGGKAAPAKAETAPVKVPEMKTIREAKGDSGTVVGAVVVGDTITSETRADAAGIKASAAVRAQARKLKIDLSSVAGSGPDGTITMADLKSGGAPAKPAAKSEIPAVTGDVSVSPSARATAGALGLDVSGIAPKAGGKMISKGDVLRAAKARIVGESITPAVPVATSKEVKAAPKVREMARQKGIDLKTVAPSGHVGNITLDDVIKTAGGVSAPAPAQAYSRPERPYAVTGKPEKLVGPRRVMAQGMRNCMTLTPKLPMPAFRPRERPCILLGKKKEMFDMEDAKAPPPTPLMAARMMKT